MLTAVFKRNAKIISVGSGILSLIILVANAQSAVVALNTVRPAFIFDLGWFRDEIYAKIDLQQRRMDVDTLENKIVALRVEESVANGRLVMLELRADAMTDAAIALDIHTVNVEIGEVQKEIQQASCELRVANGEPLKCY